MNQIEPEWTEVIEQIGPALYRFFLGSFPSQRASDLVQDTLVRLVQKHQQGDFDPSKGTLKSFAFGIAKFIKLESLRKKSEFELVENESDLDTQTVDTPGPDDQVAQLRWAINQLKPIEQELILEMIDAESNFETISQKFQMPVGTVKSHIHRAKENLRGILLTRPQPENSIGGNREKK